VDDQSERRRTTSNIEPERVGADTFRAFRVLPRMQLAGSNSSSIQPDKPVGWTGLTWTPPCGLKSLRLRIAIAARHKNVNRSRQDSFNITARYLLSLDSTRAPGKSSTAAS
jgi:hypothetical protein